MAGKHTLTRKSGNALGEARGEGRRCALRPGPSERAAP